MYSVKLSLGSEVYEKKGKSIYDALLKIKPKQYKSMGRFQITHKGVTSDIPLRLTPNRLKNLFAKDLNLEIFAKRLDTLR